MTSKNVDVKKLYVTALCNVYIELNRLECHVEATVQGLCFTVDYWMLNANSVSKIHCTHLCAYAVWTQVVFIVFRSIITSKISPTLIAECRDHFDKFGLLPCWHCGNFSACLTDCLQRHIYYLASFRGVLVFCAHNAPRSVARSDRYVVYLVFWSFEASRCKKKMAAFSHVNPDRS